MTPVKRPGPEDEHDRNERSADLSDKPSCHPAPEDLIEAIHEEFISGRNETAAAVSLPDAAVTADVGDKLPMAGFDLLYGLAAIAEYAGLKETQARHLYESHDLPVFKIGRQVCARRSVLDRWLQERQAAGRGGTAPR